MKSDLDELQRLHSLTIATVCDRIENGSQDEDGNYKPVSNDDLRIAMQLLKNNDITANLAEAESEKLRAQMARKCDFSAVKEKLEKNIATA